MLVAVRVVCVAHHHGLGDDLRLAKRIRARRNADALLGDSILGLRIDHALKDHILNGLADLRRFRRQIDMQARIADFSHAMDFGIPPAVRKEENIPLLHPARHGMAHAQERAGHARHMFAHVVKVDNAVDQLAVGRVVIGKSFLRGPCQRIAAAAGGDECILLKRLRMDIQNVAVHGCILYAIAKRIRPYGDNSPAIHIHRQHDARRISVIADDDRAPVRREGIAILPAHEGFALNGRRSIRLHLRSERSNALVHRHRRTDRLLAFRLRIAHASDDPGRWNLAKKHCSAKQNTDNLLHLSHGVSPKNCFCSLTDIYSSIIQRTHYTVNLPKMCLCLYTAKNRSPPRRKNHAKCSKRMPFFPAAKKEPVV